MYPNLFRFLVAVMTGVFVILTAGCQGGGGGGSVAEGGISGTGVSLAVTQGPIDAFGSIVVNDIRHDISTSVITVNGVVTDDTSLGLGMFVTVQGTVDTDAGTGVAESVDYQSDVEGPITAIDLVNGVVVVLGQQVAIDSLTVFEDVTDLLNLAVGDVIEVSGQVDADGVIHATRVEFEAGETEFELVGTVTVHDAGAFTFQIGAQLIDYSTALLTDIPGGLITNGLRVEVKGTLSGNTLVANEVEGEDDPVAVEPPEPDEPDVYLELNGFVTAFTSPTDFEVNGQPVTTDAATVYEQGDVNDLALGVQVEVNGLLDSNGLLTADSIEFEEETSQRTGSAEVEIEALVDPDSVNTTDGTLSMLGLTLMTSASTQFEDDRDELPSFSLADVSNGDWLEIKAFIDLITNDIVVEKLVRKEGEDNSKLAGPADNVDSVLQTLDVVGVSVITMGGTDFENSLGNDITAADFFAQAGQPDTRVEAEGAMVGGSFVAEELGIESD